VKKNNKHRYSVPLVPETVWEILKAVEQENFALVSEKVTLGELRVHVSLLTRQYHLIKPKYRHEKWLPPLFMRHCCFQLTARGKHAFEIEK
jgi:hypothetical protein